MASSPRGLRGENLGSSPDLPQHFLYFLPLPPVHLDSSGHLNSSPDHTRHLISNAKAQMSKIRLDLTESFDIESFGFDLSLGF